MAFSRHCESAIFLLLYSQVVMILELRSLSERKELTELPFIVVFRTMQLLTEKGMIKGFDDVDRVYK